MVIPRPFRHVVVVGASGGIGMALTNLLADRGAAVHALSRIGKTEDARIFPGKIDVEDETAVADAAWTLRDVEPLDLLVVATGLLHSDEIAPEKSCRQISGASFQRYFAVNATGPALVAKHFLPLLRKDGPSVFAVLSARVGSISDNGLGGWYGYRASKAALNMIVKTLAIELTRTHPNAVCVALHPGTVATELSRPFQKRVPAEQLFSPEIAAEHLLNVIGTLNASQNGAILAWDGAEISP